jgi:hypothetical protein
LLINQCQTLIKPHITPKKIREQANLSAAVFKSNQLCHANFCQRLLHDKNWRGNCSLEDGCVRTRFFHHLSEADRINLENGRGQRFSSLSSDCRPAINHRGRHRHLARVTRPNCAQLMRAVRALFSRHSPLVRNRDWRRARVCCVKIVACKCRVKCVRDSAACPPARPRPIKTGVFRGACLWPGHSPSVCVDVRAAYLLISALWVSGRRACAPGPALLLRLPARCTRGLGRNCKSWKRAPRADDALFTCFHCRPVFSSH